MSEVQDAEGAPALDLNKVQFDEPQAPEPEVEPIDPGTLSQRLFGSVFFGVVAGALGWLIYFGVVKMTGYEVGLIAILVGWLVGAGVRIGSRAVGGLGYQLLAVGITYLSIAFTYAPLYAQELAADGGAEGPLLWIVAMIVSLAAPFLSGFENIIGIAIMGFGLWQAWAMNRKLS